MDVSSNLSLPFIMAAQAQKHVTHNEALRALDAIVQLAVVDKDLDAPPGSPGDGACYIVAASPTGAWSGHAGKVAAWQDGAWAFYAPREGWLAWVADEDTPYVWTGSAWAVFAGGGGGLANIIEDATPQLGGDLDANGHGIGFDDGTGLTDDAGNAQIILHKTASAVNRVGITNAAAGSAPQIAAEGADSDIDLTLAGKGSGHPKAALLGVNATADATTKFVVAAAASLFNHAGNGHQHKINKAAAADTASLLFQTATSGRAEMGTAGDDDFHFKVSADGSTWKEAIVIDRTTGAVAMPLTPQRELLTANRTYYVRPDGSNSNTGLADTSGGAFLTIQKAIDVVSGTLDLGGHTVTVQVADGTYTGAVTLKEAVGYSAPGCLVIQGNNSTPANVVVSTTGTAIAANAINAVWDIRDLKVQTATSGHCLSAQGAILRFGNLNFGACAESHLFTRAQAQILAIGNYAVSGNANAHIGNQGLSFINVAGRTVTFSNSPVFGGLFAHTAHAGVTWVFSMTFTNGNTVTGTRYLAEANGVIFTNGGGASYLPGSTGGSAATGGQYL